MTRQRLPVAIHLAAMLVILCGFFGAGILSLNAVTPLSAQAKAEACNLPIVTNRKAATPIVLMLL